jgi:Rad3-related DNA helicase
MSDNKFKNYAEHNFETIEQSKDFFSHFVDKSFRRYQRRAIELLLESDKRYIVLEAPTGSGKSLIGTIIGNMYKSMVYLVHSKALQEQLQSDFPEFEILKGRSNYQCGINPFQTTDMCSKLHKASCSFCPYKIQKNKVLKHPLRVLNYAYFITEANYAGSFAAANIPIGIFDEADMIETLLTDFISLSITDRDIQRLGVRAPKYRTTQSIHSIVDWKKFAGDALQAVTILVKDLEHQLDLIDTITSEEDIEVSRAYKQFNSLMNRLKSFIKYVDDSWLYKEEESRYSGKRHLFQPLWITGDMSTEYLFRYITDKIIMMSATFPPLSVFSQLIGIDKSEIQYIQVPSTFPPENRPIYFQTAGDLSYKTFDQDVFTICRKIESICLQYPKEKGLIHCTSYKLRDKILEYNQGNKLLYRRFISHNTKDRYEQIEKFKNSAKPLIMVSPSMERGVSFDDDYTRFIIVAKCPYESLADKKVSQRIYNSGAIGKFWYKCTTIQTLIQSIGRGVRSETDYCDVYFIDSQIKKLIFENLGLIPNHIKQCFQIGENK